MSWFTWHISEPHKDINPRPLTAQDGVRALILLHSGYGGHCRTDMHYNVHPQPIKPEMAMRITSE